MVTRSPVAVRNPGTRRWQTGYLVRLLITDVAVITAAVVLAQRVRLGDGFDSDELGSLYSVAFALLWLAALSIFQTRTPRVLGAGLDEYRRVVSATFWVFGLVAITALLLKLDPSRGYLAVALPSGTLGLLVGRWLWRAQMIRRRSRGDWQNPLLVIGDREAVITLVFDLLHNNDHFYQVVGVGIYDNTPSGDVLEVEGVPIPILGDEKQALATLGKSAANTVAIAGVERFGARALRNLLWDLKSQDIDLLISPTSTRLMMQPIPGCSLLLVEPPHYGEAKRFHKRAFDVCFASAGLILAVPLLLIAAIAIKLTSRGPVFYAAERIGLDGRPFTMLKLRTMVDNADELLADLADQNESPGGVLFKMHDDPRVTPIGRLLRRFSVDEVPQFINVVKGDMSVVGPRPPLQREVASYDGEVRRRLLVRPGVTGLWQVSGRSDLNWDKSVGLDLSYVENWSMGTDLVIILKTFRAVLGRRGAY